MLNAPKIILTAISVLISFYLCAAQSPSNSQQILAKETTVGDVNLPAGTEVYYSQKQSPLEALIHNPAKWEGVSLPAETRVIFQDARAAWVIVPNNGVAVITGSPLSGAIARLPVKPPPSFPDLTKECVDSRGWLAPGAIPEPKKWKPLRIPSIKPQDKPTTSQHIVTLAQKYQSDDFEIPAGSIIEASDDGTLVEAFYTSDTARVFKFALPPHSLMLMHPAWATVAVQSDTQVSIFNVQAGSAFYIDAVGNIANIKTSDATDLPPGFTVPAGSTVDYEDGQLFYVRLGQPATYRGLKVNSGRYICFSSDGYSNVPLAKDAIFSDKSFPSDSYLIIGPDGQVVRAILSRPATFDGLQYYRYKPTTGPLPIVTFKANGHVHDGFLTAAAVIGGISVAQDYVRFHDDGSLERATLNGDQIIAGVPCMGGTEVMLGRDGSPIYFTASADWSVGKTKLHRGDRFTGLFTVTGTTVILDKASLNAALNGVQKQIVDERLAPEVRKNSGKFPFGNIGKITGHDFRVTLAEDHIDLHQEASVESLLTNPPFADCDSNIEIDITLKWTISNNLPHPVFMMWYSSMSGALSHDFCPGTSTIEAVATIGKALGIIHYNLQPPDIKNPLLSKQFDDKTLAIIHAFLAAAHPNGTVLDWSFKPTRVFIDQGQLKLDYEYQVQMQP